LCHFAATKWLFPGTVIIATLCGCRRQHDAGGVGDALGPPAPEVALAGLPPGRPIAVRLETTEGTIHCELDPVRTPRAVALFVGLATGRARWRDPRTAAIGQRPLYDDLTFFRAIPDAMVQSGCPLGNGTGHPGYRIAVEQSPDDARRLARPGALLLARYHPAPNRVDPAPPPPGQVIGSQFVIALTDMSHLAGEVSVIGSCSDLARVSAVAVAVASGERRVGLTRVVVEGISN
jgi:peptidyl-prolyl cis-trans isomerase A (cyclophilin A)